MPELYRLIQGQTVEVDIVLRWEACELVAAFVNINVRILAKTLSSTVIEKRGNLLVLGLVLREADVTSVQLQSKDRRWPLIFSRQ